MSPASPRPGGTRPRPAPRPHHLRLLVLTVSLLLTVAAVAGATGVLPVGPAQARPADTDPVHPVAPEATGLDLTGEAPVPPDVAGPATEPRVDEPPGRSGQGRRVVFDMSEQRVWLVRADDSVARSYPVSGSVYDNLGPGRFAVYSRSVDAVGFGGDSTMRFMVRFTTGENAAIGFHTIPVDARGERVQTVAELGTPLSDGCIRQRTVDAKALWRFAPEGTRVVVVA